MMASVGTAARAVVRLNSRMSQPGAKSSEQSAKKHGDDSAVKVCSKQEELGQLQRRFGQLFEETEALIGSNKSKQKQIGGIRSTMEGFFEDLADAADEDATRKGTTHRHESADEDATRKGTTHRHESADGKERHGPVAADHGPISVKTDSPVVADHGPISVKTDDFSLHTAGAAEKLVVLLRDLRDRRNKPIAPKQSGRTRSFFREVSKPQSTIVHGYIVSRTALKPESKFIQVWKAMLLLFCAWRVVYVPACVAFQWRAVPEYAIEVFFIVDIGIKFITGFIRSDGHTVLSLHTISYTYLTTWFAIDALGAVPCQISEAISGTPLPVTMYWLKLVPVFSAYGTDLTSFFYIWFHGFLEQIHPCLGGLLARIVVFFLLLHYAACAYWGIGGSSKALAECWFPENSRYWKNSTEGARRWDPEGGCYQYAEALHVALRSMQGEPLDGVGTGDEVHSKAYQLQIFECILGIFGVLVLSFVIGSVTSLLSALDRARTSKMEYMGRILEHMKSRNVSTSVRQKICDFYDQLYDRDYHTSYETLFCDLPSHLDMLLRTGCKVSAICEALRSALGSARSAIYSV
jgi:hypothetical protein